MRFALQNPLPEGEGSKVDSPLLQHPASHLVALDRFEQGLEVAFAETFVALALDDLEEDRADAVLGEDLQQQFLFRFHVGVDQDLVLRQPRHVLAMVRHAQAVPSEIGIGRMRDSAPAPRHLSPRREKSAVKEANVLKAPALVPVEESFDLRLRSVEFVRRNPPMPSGAVMALET